MKQEKLRKRVSVLLLALVMTVAIFPEFSTTVHAAALPPISQFATKKELQSFNTNDQDGVVNPAKVYFGKKGTNSQQWWIAGSQKEDCLTLFASSPLAADQQFEPDMYARPYSDAWGFTYVDKTPAEIVPANYGKSTIRRILLKDLETSHFTSAEQSLMKDTVIYTKDFNVIDGAVYSTTDKLYLAYGTWNENYVTVGANSADDLERGLRVDVDYWKNNGNFWLRNYYPYSGELTACIADVDNSCVFQNGIIKLNAVAPAFELNLSSVLFASAAPAALSGKNRQLLDADQDGAFTLRYETDTLGSASISYDKKSIKLVDVPENTYLIVQNNEGAWAKRITDETSVAPNEINSTLTSFENCKVWLETTDTDERKTYATLAAKKQEYSVTVTGNIGINITSNNERQEVTPNTAIQDITIEPAQGYYLPENYIDSIQGLSNGLTAAETDTGFLISGTPTADVNIILPAAEKREYSVIVTGNTGLNITSNNDRQEVIPNTAIQDITVEPTQGYYLPENYIDSIQGLSNGLIAVKTDTGFLISGTPTADVRIILPPADKITDADPAAVNQPPTLNVSDKTITVDDKFDVLKDVTAYDEEDGDITNNIEIISSTVDTSKAGTYEVVYKVTDSQGASVTKKIRVTVKPKETQVVSDEDKQSDGKNSAETPTVPNGAESNNKKGAVETGDRTNLLFWELLFIGSSFFLICRLWRKKQK